MKLIAITPESHFEGEPMVLNRLFEAGLETLHLRHPWASDADLRTILEGVDPLFRGRVVLHDGVELAAEFGVGGVHLNRRNPIPPAPGIRAVSRSCHTFEELQNAGNKALDYVFLSPVFDSISKAGYGAAFSPEQLWRARENGVINDRVVALGGVSADKIAIAAGYGFGGVAVLGAIWSGVKTGGTKLRGDDSGGGDVVEKFKKLYELTLHIS